MAINSEDWLRRRLYVYDLPPEVLATLQVKADQASAEVQLQDIDDAKREESPSGSGTSTPKSTSCQRCNLHFATVQEQRNHFKSDLHGYNTKLSLRGLKPVTEQDFDKLVGELDESISGSESSDSDSEGEDDQNQNVLSTLLKKQARLHDNDPADTTKKPPRGAGKPPIIWFSSQPLPKNTYLGIYRALFTFQEQQESENVVAAVQNKQLQPIDPTANKNPVDGGVALPKTDAGPHVFLCMVGGGHFAAMIVALTPKVGKKNGSNDRQATVLAHKTFHRYTTRRKQGGAQSANDSAKGAAHSAGSSLRRYNEVALTDEIRALLADWKNMIQSAELLFIRATGTTNKRTLFGPYDDQVLRQDDRRIRTFPFSTRRATQAELMRCFVELTRVKISQVDEAALAAKLQAEEEARLTAIKAQERAAAQKAQAQADAEIHAQDQALTLHTTQIEALIRRSKVPGLLSYLATNSISPDFQLFPPDSTTHFHSPTALHLAASTNSPATVTGLLVKAHANPTIKNAEGKTAFEVAGDRATRDAFRLARSDLGETVWNWDADAKVPEALSKAEIASRNAEERNEDEERERQRRKAGLEKLQVEEAQRAAKLEQTENEKRERKLGKGKMLPKTAEEKREEETRGMTPEMKMKLERERRARAAEERMKKMQNPSTSGK